MSYGWGAILGRGGFEEFLVCYVLYSIVSIVLFLLCFFFILFLFYLFLFLSSILLAPDFVFGDLGGLQWVIVGCGGFSVYILYLADENQLKKLIKR